MYTTHNVTIYHCGLRAQRTELSRECGTENVIFTVFGAKKIIGSLCGSRVAIHRLTCR